MNCADILSPSQVSSCEVRLHFHVTPTIGMIDLENLDRLIPRSVEHPDWRSKLPLVYKTTYFVEYVYPKAHSPYCFGLRYIACRFRSLGPSSYIDASPRQRRPL